MNRIGWILLGLAAGLVIGLYLWARPQSPAGPPPSAATAAAPAPPPTAAAAAAPTASPTAAPPGEFSFDIAQGQVRGPLSMTVRQGEQVSIRVRSDVSDELHLHGYELTAPLPAGEDVALTFIAAKAGRFEVELHHSHRELGALEVQPQ
jgi:hypothetical protein